MGVVGALLLAALYGTLNWQLLYQGMAGTMRITAMVVYILIGARVFSLVFQGVGGKEWIDGLLALKEVTPEIAAAIGQIGARTGDPARDLDENVRERAAARLEALGHAAAAGQLRTIVESDLTDASRRFGESLPHGLRLEG